MDNTENISPRIDYISKAWNEDSILSITIPNEVKISFVEQLRILQKDNNPYFVLPKIAYNTAYKFYEIISEYSKSYNDSNIVKLNQAIKSASNGENLPPILIRNGINEPNDSFIPPPSDRGFDYGENEGDRMKKFFYTEWYSWIIGILLNHDNVIHPAEHGGKNRFHAISPLPNFDGNKVKLSASTGGGVFRQHNDATVYNEFESENEIKTTLLKLGTDYSTVIERCKIAGKELSKEEIVNQILCNKYISVDVLTLTGVLNVKTHTYIGTPKQIQSYLNSIGLTVEDYKIISKMPVAHFAGPADGEISNFLGTIAPPIFLNENGDIIGTLVNSEDNRMLYVGKKQSEFDLFAKFTRAIKDMPVHKILLKTGDLLYIPNSVHGNQYNVTHGREALYKEEYEIDIGKDKFGRRHQSRQYLSSRHKNNKESFLKLFLNR